MGNSQFSKKFFRWLIRIGCKVFLWRVEKYFRTRKQIPAFENFRVRSLTSINALNFHITIAMTFLAVMTRKAATNALLKSSLDATQSIFCTIVFRMESQRYWNTPELETVTGSSQIARAKTSSASAFLRDSTPIFPTRRKDRMTSHLAGVPFLINMGN